MSDAGLMPASVYFYEPNKEAAIFFAAAFAAAGLFHLWQCIHYRCFKLTAVLLLCCALLTAGFATRGYGAFHYEDVAVYTASMLLIYMAPPLIELANYHILGRIFYFVPYFAPIHPARLLVTSACLCVVIELLTIMGISYLSNSSVADRFISVGATLAKASLVVQILVISAFLVLAGISHKACRIGRITNPKVIHPLIASYASMLLTLARTIYRTVDHFADPPPINVDFSGLDPLSLRPTVRYEWYFYVFEAAPLLLSLTLWNVWHPRRYLPENYKVYLAQDGKTQLKGPGWKDTRTLGETLFDPFSALMHRGGHQKPFWENNGYAFKMARRRGSGRV
ncbi:RTA1 domain-containing protein [Madurella fahalii]|uniref:RTA1 domain-containing protein n=1 Tax=Madurella fahalii TaxID=1157608 RepID=A0ABQ0GPX1_9PEZI